MSGSVERDATAGTGRSLQPVLDRAGAVWAEHHGQQVVRHFGDPSAEYRAAVHQLAVFERGDRVRLVVKGRAPGKMLSGILTGANPAPPVELGDGVRGGRSTYHAVLTPKGKMITDLWAALIGPEDSAGYLLDVPLAGAAAFRESLTKLLPPRLAVASDVSDGTAMITVVGPSGADALSRLALGQLVDAPRLSSLGEGEWRAVGDLLEALRVERTLDVWPEAFTVTGPQERVAALWQTLVDGGARPAGHAGWSTLRVEAGRPAFGTDMDADTIPTEAGIDTRAIDHTKGCYTGQEVIVRIRDRGHVNRSLKRLELGEVPTPAEGTELLASDGSGKIVGRITSAVWSPKHGGVLALAYVARGVERVSLGGREVSVPA